jgi:hypothetical protein
VPDAPCRCCCGWRHSRTTTTPATTAARSTFGEDGTDPPRRTLVTLAPIPRGRKAVAGNRAQRHEPNGRRQVLAARLRSQQDAGLAPTASANTTASTTSAPTRVSAARDAAGPPRRDRPPPHCRPALPGDVALEAAAVEVVDPAVASREPPATALFVRACLRGTSGEFGLEDLGGGAAGAEAGGMVVSAAVTSTVTGTTARSCHSGGLAVSSPLTAGKSARPPVMPRMAPASAGSTWARRARC